jgi:hypothetical protein
MGVYYNKADFITYGKPSLFLDFANKKSLTDRISGNNLITFSRTSTATYIGADGLIKSATTNEARFDHNPTTLESLGLLIEEQRTNYHTNNSNNLFTMAYSNWTSDSSIVYPNGGTVGGYNTFDQLSGARFFLDYNPGPGNTTYTCSVYARLKTGSSATVCSVTVKDWQSDTVRGSSGSITLTNSWQRISATGTTAGGTAGLRFEVSTNTNGASSQIYLWGAQVEVGSFPTSYIPTTTSQVTRNADSAGITGTNFSSWFNTSQGTFFANYISTSPVNARILNFDTGAVSTIISNEGVIGSGLYFSSIGNISGSASNGVKVAATTTVSESAGSFDGNSAVSTGACSYYAGATSLYFIPGTAPIKQNWIKQVRYYPIRLTNEQLQKITS